MKKLFIFIARNTLTIIGGLFIGLSIPSYHGIVVTGKPIMDLVVFFPIGVLLLGISYYYVFIYKREEA